ncbi:hypothetical protein Holit_00814 [Hollandina sp. SP2]
MELVACIYRYQNHARPGRGKEDRVPVRHIGSPDADMVPFFKTYGQKALGKLIHPLVKFAVGEPEVPVSVNKKVPVGLGSGLFPQEVPQGGFDVFHRGPLYRRVDNRKNPRRPIPGCQDPVRHDGIVIN